MIIELDGSQHLDEVEADAARTSELEAAGWTVLRFDNAAVAESLDGLIHGIRAELANIRGERLKP